MPAKPKKPLQGKVLVKEVCRRIRLAKTFWKQHRNAPCRGERTKALTLYETLTPEQKDQIPQDLRVWLRYRSEKYFGPQNTPPATKRKG